MGVQTAAVCAAPGHADGELDAWARRDAADDELGWMLAWYHALGPFVLELYGASPRLLRLAESVDPERWRDVGITAAAMARRGQMGRYWSALSAGAP